MTDPTDPIDVDAYEAAGVARIEQADDPDCCEFGCTCRSGSRYNEDGFEIEDDDPDDCEHCPNCCGCTSCMCAHHA